MKAKQLLAIPALLLAVLCMAAQCSKPMPGADVYYSIHAINNTDNSINCIAITQSSTINTDILASKNEPIDEVTFMSDNPDKKDKTLKLTFSNASSGIFADTTLTFKHKVTNPPRVQVNVTVNKDLSITVSDY